MITVVIFHFLLFQNDEHRDFILELLENKTVTHLIKWNEYTYPFHLKERLSSLLQVHGSKCIVHTPSVDTAQVSSALTPSSQVLVLPKQAAVDIVRRIQGYSYPDS